MPSELQLRAIFDSLGDGLFVASEEGRYLEVNPAGCRMMGYTLDEFRDLSLPDLLDPSQLPRLDPVLNSMAQGIVHRGEWLFVRKDRTTFTGELVGGQLPDGRYQSVVRDVTERLKHAATERLLRNEATHRTKNILAIVQAVARLTKAETQEEFLRSFEQRIAALAETHDLVMSSSWGKIDLRTLLHKQLTGFVSNRSNRVTADGPEVMLGPAAAQSLGLAIHEVATNAAKYGALSCPNGRVTVAWTCGADVPRLALRWQESGGPPVRKPVQVSFGTSLIVDVTGAALNGTSRIDYHPDGVVWSVDCPLSALAE